MSLPFLGKFGQKIRIVLIKWNFASKLIQICWTGLSYLLFLLWTEKYLFLEHLAQINMFKMKLGFYTNSNKLHLMWMFTVFVQDWKYPFWANLFQKIKIVYNQWNLALRLIQVCWIRWQCSLVLFWTRKTLFYQIWSKNIKIVCLQ